MYIYGTFKDINNVDITVHIVTNNDKTKRVEIGKDGIYFGDDPVRIESNNDDTFETIIRKSCTLRLVTDNYIGDMLWSPNARHNNVNVFKGNECVFSGFIEPNSFSQPFVAPHDEFEVNCIDGLSSLQYFPYKNINIHTFDEAKKNAASISFKGIIDSMFSELTSMDIVNNSKSRILYDLSKGIDSARTDSIFDDLSESELYMIGDDVDDVWTYEKVLQEMMKFLNLHIIQEGFDYYIFDWETIKRKRDIWYDIITKTTVSIPNPRIITMNENMFASDSTSINVGDVYNQIQVKCDLEKQESVIKSPLESSELYSKYNRQLYMTEYITRNQKNGYYYFEQMLIGKTDIGDSKSYDWYIQPMLNNNWKFNIGSGKTIEDLYEKDNNGYINQWKIPLYLKEHQLIPSIFRMGKIDNVPNKQDNTTIATIDMNDYLVISINGNEDDSEESHSPSDDTIRTLSPSIEYVGNNSGGVYSPPDDKTTNYLVFSGKMCMMPKQKETALYSVMYETAKTEEGSTVSGEYFNDYIDTSDGHKYYTRKFYSQDNIKEDEKATASYLIGKPSFQPLNTDMVNKAYQYNYSEIVPGMFKPYGDKTDKYLKLPILECELIIGNKRLIETNIDKFGNSTFQWVRLGEEPITDEGYKITTFSLGINPKIGDYILGEEYDIQNTVHYTMNLDTKGTAIPITKEDAVKGTVMFRILGVINLTWDDITRRHPSFWRGSKMSSNAVFLLSHLENIYVKDFECKVYTDNGGIVNGKEKDLIYMSAEKETYINKKDDIEFKFITQPTTDECLQKGITPSINLNAVVDNSKDIPLGKIYNAITKETAKAEEHYIDQYYKEYSVPRILLETTLQGGNDISFKNIYKSNTLNKTFYPQSISMGLKYNEAEMTLKEL